MRRYSPPNAPRFFRLTRYISELSFRNFICLSSIKAPFTRERNRSVPYRSVPNSGTLKGCVHTGTLQIISFRSKKWNDKISDTESGTIRNRALPFPCEQAMRCKTGPKNGTIRFLP